MDAPDDALTQRFLFFERGSNLSSRRCSKNKFEPSREDDEKYQHMGMVDIGMKDATEREAVGEGIVSLKSAVINLIKGKKIPKGDVLEAARLAGILAAKKTSDIIPLCHPIPIEHIKIEFFLKNKSIRIRTSVKGRAKTGFEMEALTATAIAALTIYDMCKPFDKEMVLGDIKLLGKSGGKSGTYVRNLKIKNRNSK